ncbi:MAG: hypothetical protein ABIC95_04675 [archaeon]
MAQYDSKGHRQHPTGRLIVSALSMILLALPILMALSSLSVSAWDCNKEGQCVSGNVADQMYRAGERSAPWCSTLDDGKIWFPGYENPCPCCEGQVCVEVYVERWFDKRNVRVGGCYDPDEHRFACQLQGGIFIGESVYEGQTREEFSCCGDSSDETFDSRLGICCPTADFKTLSGTSIQSCCDPDAAPGDPLSCDKVIRPDQACIDCSATGPCRCPDGCTVTERTYVSRSQSCGGTIPACSGCESEGPCVCPDSCLRSGAVIDAGEHCGATFDNTHRFESSLLGKLTKVETPIGTVFTWLYNSAGWLVEKMTPDSGRTAFSYTLTGKINESVDQKGNIVTHEYDKIGREIVETYALDREGLDTVKKRSDKNDGQQ